MIHRIIFTSLLLATIMVGYSPVDNALPGSRLKTEKDHAKKTVYVCACLGNKSCSCMTEAKMEGPCACGTQGGPPMKPVAADSDWAKENREDLAK